MAHAVKIEVLKSYDADTHVILADLAAMLGKSVSEAYEFIEDLGIDCIGTFGNKKSPGNFVYMKAAVLKAIMEGEKQQQVSANGNAPKRKHEQHLVIHATHDTRVHANGYELAKMYNVDYSIVGMLVTRHNVAAIAKSRLGVERASKVYEIAAVGPLIETWKATQFVGEQSDEQIGTEEFGQLIQKEFPGVSLSPGQVQQIFGLTLHLNNRKCIYVRKEVNWVLEQMKAAREKLHVIKEKEDD